MLPDKLLTCLLTQKGRLKLAECLINFFSRNLLQRLLPNVKRPEIAQIVKKQVPCFSFGVFGV